MKTEKFKDIPFGVLMLVIGQFFLYGVMYLAGFPGVFQFIGIILGVLIATELVIFGMKLIKGIEIDA